MKKLIFEKGQKVNDCIFVSDMPSKIFSGKSYRMAKFICYCGNEFTSVLQSVLRLKCGCGCRKGNPTHGYSKKLTEHHIWLNIKYRCNNPNSDKFHLYGGRGIRVCVEWSNSFENFLSDMGRRPSPEHSVDRIDVNGNYEPTNCRWATMKQQSRNKTNNLYLNFNNQTLCASEWSEKLNINASTIVSRIKKRGWSVEKALSTPIDTRFTHS